MLILKTIGVWLLITVAGIVLGGPWRLLDVSRLGEFPTYLIRIAAEYGVYFLVIWWVYGSSGLTRKRAVLVGLSLVVMSLSVRYVILSFFIDRPWRLLLVDYNIFKGKLQVLVLLTYLFGPLIVTLRSRQGSSA